MLFNKQLRRSGVGCEKPASFSNDFLLSLSVSITLFLYDFKNSARNVYLVASGILGVFIVSDVNKLKRTGGATHTHDIPNTDSTATNSLCRKYKNKRIL